MVPEWSLAVAFAAGLAVGVVGSRLVMGRRRPTEPVAAAAPAELERTAPDLLVAAESEDPAAAVDDVVAELERRVKGRRTEAEADRPTGRGSGRPG